MVYLYIYHKHQPNVGKYIIHMDGMGNKLNNTMFSFKAIRDLPLVCWVHKVQNHILGPWEPKCWDLFFRDDFPPKSSLRFVSQEVQQLSYKCHFKMKKNIRPGHSSCDLLIP